MRSFRPVTTAFFLIFMLVRISRSADLATQIYEKAAPSVFVISVQNANGQPISFGTGFLIARNTFVTNAHVVDGGDNFIEAGAVRLPATVEKRDRVNDLAIIKVGIEIMPLILSERKTVPGESVFVIGNPEGLEKSISTGVVAGIRDLEGRNLIQITAPISHGSSGGPVLDGTGEVLGVTVSMLKDGQNLNFAVPVERVRELMVRTSSDVVDLSTVFGKVNKYSGMHFRPGTAYFELENWHFAEQGFEQAAQLEPTDTASPFNVALCYKRLGYTMNAVKWFKEALRRNPSAEDAPDIRKQISVLENTIQ